MKRQLDLFRATALAVAAMIVVAATSRAQAPGPNSAAAQKLAMVAKQLNLTPEEKMKLLPILQAEAPKLKAIKADTSLTPPQKLEQLKAVHQETDPKVQAILTPTQYEQWQEIRKQEVMKMLQQRKSAAQPH
jgi:hypothetical protein